jgi:hypothetical protein
MQRWIALAVVVLLLVTGGAGFGLWKYKQNKPHPIWVPLQINRELPEDKRQAVADELSTKLRDKKILLQISKELRLAEKMDLPTSEAAAVELDKRLFVEVGEADSPMGKVPSINVGFRGTAREEPVTKQIVERLAREVGKIIKPQRDEL